MLHSHGKVQIFMTGTVFLVTQYDVIMIGPSVCGGEIKIVFIYLLFLNKRLSLSRSESTLFKIKSYVFVHELG